MSLLRLLRTVRHLRPVQISNRLRRRLHRPRPDRRPAPERRRPLAGRYVVPPAVEPALVAPRRLRLLGETQEISAAADWQTASTDRLWLYHLHYFDDLVAEGAPGRRRWQEALLHRWVAENPPAAGVGWEAYPISRRVPNWVHWCLQGGELTEDLQDSLAVQVRYLSRRVEWHLLGNHVLANAAALLTAGVFFDGKEAEAWRRQGERILTGQLAEQILADGGHCERSPMYHAVVLKDLLDLLNLARTFGEAVPAWRERLPAMLSWLDSMCHPDGRIALFNDSAFDGAAPAAALRRYAAELELTPDPPPAEPLRDLAASGYAVVRAGPAVAFLDAAPLGPDYQPGHGHADTLSFELSVHGERLVVDAGVSLYRESAERLRQRGTAAHNTLTVDEADSSELWGAFRVARRARVRERHVHSAEDGTVEVTAAHDGYRRLPGGVVHRRTWRLAARSLRLTDEVLGGGEHDLCLRLHLHPEASVRRKGDHHFVLYGSGGRKVATLYPDVALEARIAESAYHPAFGAWVASQCVEARRRTRLPMVFTCEFVWE